MKTKKCKRCGKIKLLSEFYNDKGKKDEYGSWCRECVKKYLKKYRQNNKKKLRNWKQKYRQNNIDKIKKKKQKWYQENKERINEKNKKWQQDNKEKFRECKKKYQQTHKKEANKRQRQRRKEDINFRISYNYRTRVNRAIKYNWKSGHTLELLHCSIDYLKEYLAKQFNSKMTWENYGTYWEIDHIRPCCSFDLSKKSEQRKCFHYSNLQPLTVTENRIKGGKT